MFQSLPKISSPRHVSLGKQSTMVLQHTPLKVEARIGNGYLLFRGTRK